MDRYPHWQFVASQAVQWEWLKEDYPQLLQDIKPRIKEGRFVPIGASYVEFDANIPCGEAMVRQFLYGLKIFRSELNTFPRVFWLPDTFGYSGQIPQIMSGFQIPYFLSQKLSWNLFNKFPHSTFFWEGIDGSRVLSHFPPADTYNSHANVNDIYKSYENHQSKDVSNRSMLLFGNGDGGGGPSVTHLEQLTRIAGAPALPQVKVTTRPEAFFELIETEDFGFSRSSMDLQLGESHTDFIRKEISRNKLKVGNYCGELYLELHQGTLTSQALVKKRNRQCEQMMKTIEALLVRVALVDKALVETPEYAAVLSRTNYLWRQVLLNQFHDVIRKLFHSLVKVYFFCFSSSFLFSYFYSFPL